jgi:hypothetical protein
VRKRIVALSVLGWLLAGVPPAAADEMSALMPELLTLTAPSWVKPGCSLTFHTAAASVPGSAGYFWRNEDGDWVGRGPHDKGKTYSRGNQFGIGGEGYSQVDIVAAEGKTVAVNVRTWAKHQGKLLPKTDLGAAHVGGAGPAGCVGNWWVNATALKDAVARFGRKDRPAAVRDVRVFATPCRAGNRTFETIRFEVASEGNHSGRNYDVPTGLLVHGDTSATSREKANTWSGDASALSLNEFESIRQLTIPWAGGDPPTWITSVRRLVFEGTYAMLTPGAVPFRQPYRVTMDVGGRGRTWFQYRASTEITSVGGLPPIRSQYDLVSGLAQIGGLWVPAGAGRGVPVTTVLDRNPAVGTNVTLTQNSGNTLAITETGRDHTTRWVYDTNTGALQSLQQEIRPMYIRVELRRVQVQ